MIDLLLHIDHDLFTFLNGLHSAWMDPVQYWISNKFIWIPFYAFLLFLLFKHYKKRAVLAVVFIVTLITSTDQLSGFSKRYAGRYRPCREESWHRPRPHLVDNHCGGAYGFFSAHASSAFGLAVFVGTLLMPVFNHARKYMLFWAAIVAYSRVYLGVHYPSDIFVGALVGLFLGFLFTALFKWLSQVEFSSK